MAGLFLIYDHSENPHVMSDLHIRNIIIKQSKESNYNWLAPADELLRVCNKSRFNKNYAKDILVAIVKCYTQLMFGQIPNDIIYAYKAMQELKKYEDNAKIQKVREDFVRRYIHIAIFWIEFDNFHETFENVKKEWVLKKMQELLSEEKEMPSFKSLNDEFYRVVSQRKKDGTILFKGLEFNISDACSEWKDADEKNVPKGFKVKTKRQK